MKYIVLCAGMMVGVVQGTEGPNPSDLSSLPEDQGNQREKLFRLTENLSSPNTSAEDLLSWRQCFTKALPYLSQNEIKDLLKTYSTDSYKWNKNNIFFSAIKLGDIDTVDYIMNTALPAIKGVGNRGRAFHRMLKSWNENTESTTNLITDTIVYGRSEILSKLINNTYLSKVDRIRFIHEALGYIYDTYTPDGYRDYRSPEDFKNTTSEKIIDCLKVLFDKRFLSEEQIQYFLSRTNCFGTRNIIMWLAYINRPTVIQFLLEQPWLSKQDCINLITYPQCVYASNEEESSSDNTSRNDSSSEDISSDDSSSEDIPSYDSSSVWEYDRNALTIAAGTRSKEALLFLINYLKQCVDDGNLSKELFREHIKYTDEDGRNIIMHAAWFGDMQDLEKCIADLLAQGYITRKDYADLFFS